MAFSSFSVRFDVFAVENDVSIRFVEFCESIESIADGSFIH